MLSLESRATGEEIMDDLDCDGAVVFQTLRELEFINKYLGGNAVTLSGVARLLKGISVGENLSVVDLGCGSGDILKHLYQWGVKHNVRFSLTGVDANPNIISYAAAHSDPHYSIQFKTENILSDDFRRCKYDLIIATLFTHHFSHQQLIDIFASLYRQARTGIVINDIHRHWLSFYSIRLLTRLFSKSSMVKYDAPLSVLRAFRKNELKLILKDAGIEHYELRWRWAFRWRLIIPIRHH